MHHHRTRGSGTRNPTQEEHRDQKGLLFQRALSMDLRPLPTLESVQWNQETRSQRSRHCAPVREGTGKSGQYSQPPSSNTFGELPPSTTLVAEGRVHSDINSRS